MNNNFYEKIKKWIGPTLTILTIIALFGIVFLEVGLAERSSRFYTELGCVSILAIQQRIYWYETTEDRVLASTDIKDAKNTYYTNVDKLKIDINELDICLAEMDEENYAQSIKSSMGHYTPANIGKKKYDKRMKKAMKKAHKIKKLKSTDVLTRGDSPVLYDSKNYQKEDKISYQIFSSVISILMVVVISGIAFEEIRLNWENAFRYIMYIWSILVAMIMTIIYSNKKTKRNILDHLARLQFILDKFSLWRDHKNKEVVKQCHTTQD